MNIVDRARLNLARRRQRGLTLIEAAMVLGIAALFIAGVMVMYNRTNTTSRTNSSLTQLNMVIEAVRNIYGGQGAFTGLSNASLIASNSLPQGMVASGALVNSFNGAVTLGPDAATGFTVQFDGLPPDVCMVMATKDYGRSLVTLKSSSGTIYDVASSTGIPSPSTVTGGGNCTANTNSLIWDFAN